MVTCHQIVLFNFESAFLTKVFPKNVYEIDILNSYLLQQMLCTHAYVLIDCIDCAYAYCKNKSLYYFTVYFVPKVYLTKYLETKTR